MAKVNIIFEKTISFGEIIHLMEIKATTDNANTTDMNITILLMLHKRHIY